jgi:uncharacterized protein YdhG (YjbR/CyaY superfamily)
MPTNQTEEMNDMTAKPSTVDDYIGAFPEPARARLSELRTLLRSAAPAAVEELKWGSPAFCHSDGVILMVLSGHRAHTNVVFTPSTRAAFAAELTDLETGKGSVKIPYSSPVPADLLTRMVQYRIVEHEDDGVNWM